MLTIKGITKQYENAKRPTLNNVNIAFPETGLYFILGKSGSGKTTLLNLLAGIDTTTSGEIIFEDIDLCKLNEHELDIVRNEKFSIIFQEFNLFSHLTVYDNVKISVDIQNWDEKTEDEVNQLIEDALSFVGLREFANRKISELSGGEVQRVAVARAVVRKPKVIYADEPTGNLDYYNSRKIMELLQELSRECLVIVITHDRDAVDKYGDGYYEIKDGEVAELVRCNNDESYYYDISVNEQDNQVLNSSALELHEVKNCLASLIMECDKREQEYTVKISRMEKVVKHMKFFVSEARRTHIHKSALPGKCLTRFAMSVMKTNFTRLFITTIMLCLTIVLLLFSFFMVKYDIYKVIKEYFQDYEISQVYPIREVSYTDSFGDTYSKMISKGEIFWEMFQEQSLNCTWIKEDVVASYENQESFKNNKVSVYLGNEDKTNDLSKGTWCKKNNEIVITDYVANSLGIEDCPVGKELKLNGVYVTVAGIVETDYLENEMLIDIKHSSSIDAYAEFELTHRYNVIYASQDFISLIEENADYIYLSCSDILTPIEGNYVTSYDEYKISSTDGLSIESLITGRLPQNDNEVLISYSYAEEKGYLKNGQMELSDSLFALFDLRKDNCKEYAMDELNLYDFFPNGIIIVGIYDDGNAQYQDADIVFEESVFETIQNDYFRYYFYDSICISLEEENYNDFLKFAKQEKIMFNNPSVYKMREFDGMIKYFGEALLFASCMLVVIVVLMIYNYVECSINSSKKEIGILRAIGASKEDTLKIYTIESMLLFFISMVIATISSIILVDFVNYQYQKDLTVENFKICYFDPKIYILILMVCLCVFVLSIICPIIKFSNKKPIQVIKG